MSAPTTEAPKPFRFVVDRSNPLVRADTKLKLDDEILNLAKLSPVAIAQNLCQLTANPLAQDVNILSDGMFLLNIALKTDETQGITPEFLTAFETFGELVPGVIRKACVAGTFKFDSDLMHLDEFAKRASTKKTSIGILGTIMGNLDSDDTEKYISKYHSKLPLDVYAGSVAHLARNPRLATHPELVEYALYGLEKKFDATKPEVISSYEVRSAVSSYFSSLGYALTRHEYDDSQIAKHIAKPYFEIVRKNPHAVKASLGYYQGMVEATSAPARRELFVNEVLGPILKPPIEPIASRYMLLTQVTRSGDTGQLQDNIDDIFEGLSVPNGKGVKVEPKLVEDFFQAWNEKIDTYGVINEEALVDGVTSFVGNPANADLRMAALPLVKKLARQVSSEEEWDKCVGYNALKHFSLQSAVEVMTEALENERQSLDLIKKGEHVKSTCYSLKMHDGAVERKTALHEGERDALKRLIRRSLYLLTDTKFRPDTPEQISKSESNKTLGLGYLYGNPVFQPIMNEALQEFTDEIHDPQALIAMISHLDRFPPQLVAQMVARIEPTKYDLKNGLAGQVISASIDALSTYGSELNRTISQPATQELFETFFAKIRGLAEIALADKKTVGLIVPPLSRLMGNDRVIRNGGSDPHHDAPKKFFAPQTQEIFGAAFSTSDRDTFTNILTALANNEENFIHNNEAGDQMRVIDMIIKNPLSLEKENATALLKLITSFRNDFPCDLYYEIKRGEIDLPTCKIHIESLRAFVNKNKYLKKAIPEVDDVVTRFREFEKHITAD